MSHREYGGESHDTVEEMAQPHVLVRAVLIVVEVYGRYAEGRNIKRLDKRRNRHGSTACPFLHDNLCAIYEHRPLVCREYIVAGSFLKCRIGGGNVARKVKLPIRILNVVSQLSTEMEGTNVEVVALPCVFDWYQKPENVERRNRTWPALLLVEQFINILSREAEQKSQQLTSK